MLTDGRTDGRTDDGRKVITIAHPEQSSGELKIQICYFFISSPHMKFQNPSIYGALDMIHPIRCDGLTD